MITPLTMSSEDMEKATDDELVEAYMRDGRSRAEAEAIMAASTGDFIVD